MAMIGSTSHPMASRLRWLAAFPVVFFAFMWGAAEGAFFFIVPDVLLTYVAIRHGAARALWCAIAAALGALEGGIIVYTMSLFYPELTNRLLDMTVSISPAMIEMAQAQMQQTPFLSMLLAGFTGMPYKIYAAAAPQAGLSVMLFGLMTLGVRLLRFVIVALAAAIAARLVRNALSTQMLVRIWLAAWVAFYALYWSQVG